MAHAPRKKRRTTTPVLLWLDSGDVAAMRAIRAKTGIPVVQQVRRAVALTLQDSATAAAAFQMPERSPSRTRGGARADGERSAAHGEERADSDVSDLLA